MESVNHVQLEFAIGSKVIIEFYGDGYGKQVRARYSTEEGVEHGYVVTLGMRRSDGKPHTVESAIVECLQTLLENCT